ncbi:HTTM domain-containing protein [Halogranum rubrum]|uniref:HTTM-like domain-containing protein n=1 Tax=Halogranum salarium B-1 TaxID=1210908 RepID=J3JEZ4_9EURY|nr:HTTM domain-containing protein [Halogranum salarium]EJN58809.1 hypothetical protein HSB1_28900 [Halogranum salarium B-1]
MSRSVGPTVLARGREAVARRVGVDVRALAVFRVSLGLLLLLDLLLRSRNLVAFYTDAGTLPRSLLAAEYPTFAELSLHALSGAAWWQGLLFVVAGVLALSLLVGYRTKTTLLLSWLLLVSLHARNPLVLNGGDSLLRRLLFWGLFLPLGRRWSLDSLRRERREGADHITTNRVATVASAALLTQVVLVYATNAVIKLRGEYWRDGTAIVRVFSLDQMVVFLGDVLAGYPEVLHVFGELWLVMVVASPLLLVLTGRARGAFAALFVGMHLGMLSTMKLGIFPLVSVVALLAFFPPSLWQAVESRVVDPLRRRDRVARGMTRLDGLLPAVSTESVHARVGRLRTLTVRLVPAVVTVLLALILVWNAMSVGLVATPDVVESNVEPGQLRWNMFAPGPLSVDGWFVVPGRLDSGERVDAFRRAPVDWEKPADVDKTYPSARWRKYLQDVRWSGDDDVRRGFASYLCHRWNTNHDDELQSLTVSYVQQPTRLDGPEPTERVTLLEHTCSG